MAVSLQHGQTTTLPPLNPVLPNAREVGCRSEPLSAALVAVITLSLPTEVNVLETDSGRQAAGCLVHRLWAAGVATSHQLVASEHGRSTLAALGTAEEVAAAYRRARPPGPVHRAVWFLGVLGNASAAAPTLSSALHESQRVTAAVCEPAGHAACVLLTSSSPGDGAARLSEVGSVTGGRVTLPAPPPDWRLKHLGGRVLTVLLDPAGRRNSPCDNMLLGYRRHADGRHHLCGYLGETLALLVDKLGFGMKVKRGYACGMVYPNGSAYGRLAALQRGEADVGVGSCTVMYERVRAVDMAEWHWTGTTTFMTAAPQPLRPPLLIFQVYRPVVWALVLALPPVAATLRWLIAGAERRCRLPSRRRPWPSLLVDSVAMLSGQGVSSRGAGAAGRALIFFLEVVAVTLAAVYAGNLTAFLSLPRWQPPLDSLQQLADSRVQPHVVRGHSQFHMFQNQTDGVRGRIWAKMAACADCIHDRSGTTHEISFIRRIASGEVTLFQSPRALSIRAQHYMRETPQPSGRCPFHLARENLRRDFYAMMLQKNSMYTPLFDDVIRWLKQFGIIEYLYRRNVPSTCTDTDSAGGARGDPPTAAMLDLHALRGAFFCWLAGMVVGLLTLAVERCWPACAAETICGAVLEDDRRRRYAAPSSLSEIRHSGGDPMLRLQMFQYEIRDVETVL